MAATTIFYCYALVTVTLFTLITVGNHSFIIISHTEVAIVIHAFTAQSPHSHLITACA